jgi:hypothetical protein
MTEKTKKEPVELKDRLGRVIKVDDCVATSHHNQLMIGRVTKINPKMVKVMKVGSKTSPMSSWRPIRGYNKYPEDCVILEGPDVTMFLLTVNNG